MNYFAHGLAHLDRPYFLAGTALPDWLSVVDRKLRLRTKSLTPQLESSELAQRELAAGALRHLEDDAWFHSTRGFAEVTAELTELFRQRLNGGDGFWCGFLGHVVTELLIDAALEERYPDRLERYYAMLSEVDPRFVEHAVEQWTGQRPQMLATFVELFVSHAFLRDYADDERLLVRLNQVLRRVKLTPLPDATAEWIGIARSCVRERLDDLLPSTHFEWP